MSDDTSELPRILVVDDDPTILKLLKTLLTRARYRVTSCDSASAALRLLSQGTKFDCLVTDAVMPLVSGYDFVRALKAHVAYREIPVLMLTRKSDRDDVKKAMEAGVNDYVLKPIDEHLLLDKIKACMKPRRGDTRMKEATLHGANSNAELTFGFQITSVRETGMVVRLPFAIPDSGVLKIDSQVFREIGIAVPLLKRIRYEVVPPFEAEYAFVGMEESNLKKIRAWLQKYEISRKK